MTNKFLILAFLLAAFATLAPAYADDTGNKINSEIATKIGALEITNTGLSVQLDAIKKELGEIRTKCGDACKTPEPTPDVVKSFQKPPAASHPTPPAK